MTFREKSRWAALIIDLAIWSWYFSKVATVLPDGPAREMDFLWLTIGATIGSIMVHVGAMVALAVAAPADADAPADERERVIERDAASKAYTVLAFGLVMAVLGSFYDWSKFTTVNAVLLAFVLAELSRYVLEIVAYRRAAA